MNATVATTKVRAGRLAQRARATARTIPPIDQSTTLRAMSPTAIVWVSVSQTPAASIGTPTPRATSVNASAATAPARVARMPTSQTGRVTRVPANRDEDGDWRAAVPMAVPPIVGRDDVSFVAVDGAPQNPWMRGQLDTAKYCVRGNGRSSARRSRAPQDPAKVRI